MAMKWTLGVPTLMGMAVMTPASVTKLALVSQDLMQMLPLLLS